MANQAYASLKAFILRKLGSPVINVEITDDQLEDCIDLTLQEFHESHYDGTFVAYIPFTLLSGVTAYQLNDNVQSVVQILTSRSLSVQWKDDDPLLVSRFYVGSEESLLRSADLVDVEVFRQNFKMYADFLEVPLHFNYNATSSKLYLATEPEQDMAVFLKVFMWDDDDVEAYLGEKWCMEYATALARLQWGDNLSKYEGGNLPGGATFNYQGIIDRAQTDLERLREELEDELSLPLDPEVG